MKKYFIFLLFSFTSHVVASEKSSVDPIDLKATIPKTIDEIGAYKKQHSRQADFFFDHLPNTPLPANIEQEIERVFGPLLPLLAPIYPNQTQPERQAQVMKHIKGFYGLLYLLAEEEAIQNQVATTGTGKNTKINTNTFEDSTPPQLKTPLTAKQLAQSGTWQNHLKIMIASSYNEELFLLQQVHQLELQGFDFLPQFEAAYYENAFVQLRASSEFTRMYLILVDRMRKRFIQGINRTSEKSGDTWGYILEERDTLQNQLIKASGAQKNTLSKQLLQLNNQLFERIAAFKESPFYTIAMAFQNVDWTKTYEISFSDQNGNPITFQEILSGNFDFDQYFTVDKKTKEVAINPIYSLVFELVPSQSDPKKQTLALTGFGNLLFNGNITYSKKNIKIGKKNVYKGTFQPAPGPSIPGKKQQPPLLDQFFVTKTTSTVVNKKKIQQTSHTPTFGYVEILSYFAMKTLHNDVSSLFTNQNLKFTFEKMVTTELPNFIAIRPEDYFILEDINNLQTFLGAQNSESQQAIPQGLFGSVSHFFKHAWHTIESKTKKEYESLKEKAFKDFKKIKKFGLKALEKMKSAAYTSWHGLKAFGYGVAYLYYATRVAPMIFQGETYQQASNRANKLKAEARQQSETFNKQCKNEADAAKNQLKHIKNLAEEAVSSVASITDETVQSGLNIITKYSMLNKIDPTLSNDMKSMVESVSDGMVLYFKDSTDLVIEGGYQEIRLSVAGVDLLKSVIVGIVTGKAFSKNGIRALGKSFETFAEVACSAVLETMSVSITMLEDALESAMLFLAYFINSLVDAVIQISAAAADIFWYGWKDNFNFAEGYNTTNAKISQHRRLITGLVVLALVIGVTIGTGGAAGAVGGVMLGMMCGTMIMGIYGDAQQDAIAIHKAARQKAFVSAFKQYVINNAQVIEGTSAEQIIEQLVQLQTETMNQERAIMYYQNYLNSLFNNSKSISAYSNGYYINKQIGQRYMAGSEKDNTGVMKGDLGSLYGIQTGRMNLSPAGGFSVYNQGRGTFSQESAILPMAVPNQPIENALDPKKQVKTFWFQQKDLSNIPSSAPLKADILWRSIYEADAPFYIGIYLTERFFDSTAMKSLYTDFNNFSTPNNAAQDTQSFTAVWNKLDTFNRYMVDYDHLAKMFVCYRTAAPAAPGTAPTVASTPRLGVYVHEASEQTATPNTNGWLEGLNYPSITFKRGTWYRMQAELNGTQLTTRFWQVGSDENAQNAKIGDTPPENAISKTMTVEKSSMPSDVLALSNNVNLAGSMGVITSGASVEYIVLEPSAVALLTAENQQTNVSTLSQPTPTFQRKTANAQLYEIPGMSKTEAQREIEWRKELAQLEAPTFGNFTLKALSKDSIIQSEFIYETTGKYSSGLTDYVVFAKSGTTRQVTEVGMSPLAKPQPDQLLSLVSGEVYDNSGAVITRINNPITLYEKQHPKLSPDTQNRIHALRKKFWSEMAGPFKFKNLTLNGDTDAMARDAFVYSGPSLDNAAKTDYYVTASMGVIGISETGQPIILGNPSNTISMIISLITGEVYNLELGGNAPSTITTANIGSISIVDAQTTNDIYNQYQPKLSKAMQTLIETERKAFKTNQANQQIITTIESSASSTLNTLSGLVTELSNDAVLAYGSYATALTSAQTNVQKAASQLQTALNKFKTAPKESQANSTSLAYMTLEKQINASQPVINDANSAITSYNNAPAQTLSSGSTGYGSSSSSENYNTNYGSYSSGGYGAGAYGSGGYGSDDGY